MIEPGENTDEKKSAGRTWAPAKNWLNRNLLFSKLAGVQGKETLATQIIEEWSRELGQTISERHRFEGLRSLQHSLSTKPEIALEVSLESLEQKWKSGAVVLWQNLHCLHPASQNMLINFLRSSTRNAIHILHTEQPILDTDLPLLSLPDQESFEEAPKNSDIAHLAADDLDSLSSSDLRKVKSVLDQRPGGQKSAGDLLLFARCIFLLGQRAKAFEVVKEFLLKESLGPLLQNRAGQELLLEALRLANRNGRFEESKNLAPLLPQPHKLSESQSYSFELERIIADEHLKSEATTRSLDSLIERHSELDHKRFVAEALFQRARVYDARDERERALFDYQRSGAIFKSLELPYQSCTALLNSCWILVEQMKWESLARSREEILKLSRRYGYPHILASLDTIEAQRLRLHGQLHQALLVIQKSIERLESHEAPRLMLTDSILERGRILLALGQRRRATESVEEYQERLDPTEKRSLQRIRVFLSEMSAFTGSALQWLDEESKRGHEASELHAILSAERGQLEIPAEAANILLQFPVGKLALQQNALLRGIDEQGTRAAEVLMKADEFYRSTEQLPELLMERALSSLVRAELKIENRESALRRARDLLLSSSAESSALEGLRLWALALEQARMEALLESPEWQRLPLIDRERWEMWIQKFHSELIDAQSGTEYYCLPQGKLSVPPSLKEIERFKAEALFVDDRRNEILFKGKKLKNLEKKGVLYDLLKILIQAGDLGHSKEELAALIWGEDYRPPIHDPRIYVGVRRLRTLLRDSRIVVQHRGRYVMNAQRSALLIREKRSRSQLLSNNEKKVLLTLRSRLRAQGSTEESLTSRSDLQKILNIPEATLKRSLLALIRKQEIKAIGNGRSRRYYI